MFRLTVLLAFLLTGFGAHAGSISGTVRDAKDTSAMIGVIVNIAGTSRMAQTDMDGRYEFSDVADGSYILEFNYVTYNKQTLNVTVANGATAQHDVTMKATGNQLSGTTVRSNRRTNTESSVILEIKKSNVVVSGISAAQISKTMDRNAADVVKRIPGVTIQEDRFINVRGLADRYNTVWLNDAGAPSSETDKKAFSFDIIPSGLIDRILVYKTPSAELPGDFAGGMVKVYTTSIPEKNTYTFGVSSSYRSGSTGTDFFHNKKSSTDWLGYDDGSRSLPSIITNNYVEGTENDIREVSKSFGNDFQVFNKKQPVDFRVNGSASNVFKLGGVKIGSTVGVTYSNVYTNYNWTRLDYESAIKQYNYHDLQSINKVSVGALANLAAVIGNSKIEFKNLYSQIGASSLTQRTSNPDSFASPRPEERSYAMGYESKATYATQLTGSHHNNSDSRKYTWALGYSDVYRSQPNLRRLKYTYDESRKQFQSAVPAGAPDPINAGRYYAALFENVYSFSHQLTQKIRLSESFDFDLNLGNYLEYKERTFEARQFGYSLRVTDAASQALSYLPVNDIFADQNVGAENQFRIKEGTADYDKYNASNRLIASFISATIPVTARIKVVAGLHYEDNLAKLTGYAFPDTLKPEITTRQFLPSINASYNFSQKSLVRAAYGKTVNRPEFRETAPFYFYDFDRRAGIYGAMTPTVFNGGKGDTLDIAKVQNIDVRYEYYPSPSELVQVGGFYKHFKDPIQQVSYNAGGRAFTTINAASAYCYGVEVDARKNLGFLDDKLKSNLFSNFTIVGNLTLSKSELTIDTTKVIQLPSKARLEGQSNYVVNTGVFYQNDTLGLQGSLLYNVYGPRMFSIGFADDGNIADLAFHSLDFSLTKTFFKKFQINLGVQNLLDQSVRQVLDGNKDGKYESSDLQFTTYKPGRYFTAGLRVHF